MTTSGWRAQLGTTLRCHLAVATPDTAHLVMHDVMHLPVPHILAAVHKFGAAELVELTCRAGVWGARD